MMRVPLPYQDIELNKKSTTFGGCGVNFRDGLAAYIERLAKVKISNSKYSNCGMGNDFFF